MNTVAGIRAPLHSEYVCSVNTISNIKPAVDHCLVISVIFTELGSDLCYEYL